MNSATRPHSSFERSDWGGNIRTFSLRYSGQRRNQAVGLRQHAEMMIGVAERGVDGGDALEVVADLVLHGHADAAVQLDGALADDAAGATDLHLGGGDRLAPVARGGL